jgi:hypothetical protein
MPQPGFEPKFQQTAVDPRPRPLGRWDRQCTRQSTPPPLPPPPILGYSTRQNVNCFDRISSVPVPS